MKHLYFYIKCLLIIMQTVDRPTFCKTACKVDCVHSVSATCSWLASTVTRKRCSGLEIGFKCHVLIIGGKLVRIHFSLGRS